VVWSPRLEVENLMSLRNLFSVGAAAALVFGLAACDQQEQGRVLRYEKGTYLGNPDTGLSEAQREELRARTMMQGGG